MNVTLPDGTVIRDVPDGMSKADLVTKLKANGYDISKLEAPKPKSAMDAFIGEEGGTSGIRNFVGKDAVLGAVRGAAGIGATIMQPFQALEDRLTGKTAPTLSSLVTGQKPASTNQETRAGIEGGMDALGADKSSIGYQGGKLGAEIAGTSGAGPVLGSAAKVVGAAPRIVSALTTSGFRTGAAPAAGDLAIRSVAGAAAGGAQTAMVDPEHADTGALIGGALPGVLKVAGAAGQAVGNAAGQATDWAARKLMQSALKPTIQQLKSGEAATAVQTLLDYGINATEGGVNKLKEMIAAKNAEISNMISGSTATVNKQRVVGALSDTRTKFGNQVSPTNDLAAISNVEGDFLNHPNLPGQDIPVQAAQQLKQGTYKVLKGKYGQMGSAETEAQKSLARGLKEEIATAVPGVGPLNAEESRLLTTLSVAERRALMDMNKNPIGLSALAGNPISFAAFMADRSAAFKSLAARMVNNLPQPTNQLQGMANSSLPYRAAPLIASDR